MKLLLLNMTPHDLILAWTAQFRPTKTDYLSLSLIRYAHPTLAFISRWLSWRSKVKLLLILPTFAILWDCETPYDNSSSSVVWSGNTPSIDSYEQLLNLCSKTVTTFSRIVVKILAHLESDFHIDLTKHTVCYWVSQLSEQQCDNIW